MPKVDEADLEKETEMSIKKVGSKIWKWQALYANGRKIIKKKKSKH